MTRNMTGIVKIAGSLAMAGGIIAMAAMPAAAASPNEAYGSAATGPISASPIGLATYPGTSPVTVSNANITGLLTTGTVTDTAGPTSASSTVSNVSATLSTTGSLGATSVTSSCTFNTTTGAVSGTAAINGGAVHVSGRPTITLAANPAKNTTISVAGVATLILNKQTKAADGTLTVTAIYVRLLGSTQTLSIGASVCNAANLAPVPMVPGKALPFALGGLGVLLIGGVAYRATRRGRFTTAA
jgi:hypothetical protein